MTRSLRRGFLCADLQLNDNVDQFTFYFSGGFFQGNMTDSMTSWHIFKARAYNCHVAAFAKQQGILEFYVFHKNANKLIGLC